MSARQVRVFGLVIFGVLLMPIPIAIAEAVVWQNWTEPVQRSQVRADGDRLVFALESFHERAGHYPDALDELVPNEIDHVPTQPDGSPFWYTTDGTNYIIRYKLPSRSLLVTTCSYSPEDGRNWWQCID
jgi:hypothetical protein